MSDRRTFLRSLVSLPLIGGGVTLIGRPAAPVPLIQAAAMPALADPFERARYAWEAFSSAMREITADADGWRITGAGEIRGVDNLRPVSFLRTAAVHYCRESEDRVRGGIIVERHSDFDLGDSGPTTRAAVVLSAIGVPLTGG